MLWDTRSPHFPRLSARYFSVLVIYPRRQLDYKDDNLAHRRYWKMEDLNRLVLKESLLYHAMWMVPLFVGIAVVTTLLVSKGSIESKVYSTFGWALVVVVLGLIGVYVNWELLMGQIGATGDVPWVSFKPALLRTCTPVVVGVAEALGLFLFITVLRTRREA
jgi:hypothetical protein